MTEIKAASTVNERAWPYYVGHLTKVLLNLLVMGKNVLILALALAQRPPSFLIPPREKRLDTQVELKRFTSKVCFHGDRVLTARTEDVLGCFVRVHCSRFNRTRSS